MGVFVSACVCVWLVGQTKSVAHILAPSGNAWATTTGKVEKCQQQTNGWHVDLDSFNKENTNVSPFIVASVVFVVLYVKRSAF